MGDIGGCNCTGVSLQDVGIFSTYPTSSFSTCLKVTLHLAGVTGRTRVGNRLYREQRQEGDLHLNEPVC